MCPKVRPVGLADVLSDAMRKQMDLVQSSLNAVRTAETLNRLLKEWIGMEESKLKEKDADLRKFAYGAYALIIESDNVFRTSELPSIHPVMKKLQEIEVDGQRFCGERGKTTRTLDYYAIFSH